MKLLNFILTLLVVSACNKKEDKTVEAPKAVTYGTYKNCINDDNISTQNVVLIDENHVTETNYYYLYSDCQPANLLGSDKFVYAYTSLGSSKYDLTIVSGLSTSHSSIMTTEMNNQQMCGFNNWLTNVPKNILGVSCDGETLPRNFNFDLKIYKSNGKLVVDNGDEKTKYSFVGGWDFNANPLLKTGNYVYYDGLNGIHLSISGSNYTATYFDKDSLKYFTETGSVAVSGNLNFTVGAYSNNCGTDIGSTHPYRVSFTDFSAGLKDSDDVAMLFEWHSTQLSLNDFKTAYLIDSYTAGCF